MLCSTTTAERKREHVVEQHIGLLSFSFNEVCRRRGRGEDVLFCSLWTPPCWEAEKKKKQHFFFSRTHPGHKFQPVRPLSH